MIQKIIKDINLREYFPLPLCCFPLRNLICNDDFLPCLGYPTVSHLSTQNWWSKNEWWNPEPTMAGWQRRFLRCRYSNTASALILSLLVSIQLLHLAHHKFTFLLFRSNYSCLYSHFNFVALAITKLHLQKHLFEFVIWIGQANLVPSASMLGKAAVGHVWRMR